MGTVLLFLASTDVESSSFYAFIAINSILSICFSVSKDFCILYIYIYLY